MSPYRAPAAPPAEPRRPWWQRLLCALGFHRWNWADTPMVAGILYCRCLRCGFWFARGGP